MGPITKRRIGTGFTLTQKRITAFLSGEFLRLHLCSRVAAVTKRLIFGFPATAPEIGFAFFQLHFDGSGRRNNGHITCHVTLLVRVSLHKQSASNGGFTKQVSLHRQHSTSAHEGRKGRTKVRNCEN
mmetsp:Transcript_23347/g.40692  ORF Transcript_23347/g.40692 Transcript_23347/m.40692 type:complete len:127 (-) Transcript_23347:3327-3707(-)